MAKSVEEKREFQQAMFLAYARQGLDYFLNCITIPASPEPAMFGDVADPWQRELLGPKIPAFEHLCGRNPEYTGPMRFMSILARGHNKSSLEAWLAVGTLLSSLRHIKGYVLAADRDQGKLILQAVEELLLLNPWLRKDITLTKDTLTGPAGFVQVLPRDAKSAMGLRGNLFILDEITHWSRQAEWTAIMSGVRKVTPCLIAVLSNAGLEGSWQHEAFLEACAHPETWTTFHRAGLLASWLDAKGLEADKRMLPPSEAERLFDNKWIDPASEHDYLRRLEVNGCAEAGRALDLMNRVRRQTGVNNYVAAGDYGPRKDRTVLVVGHTDRERRVIVDRMDVWEGKDYPSGTVPIENVETWIREQQQAFQLRAIVLDPYQMEGTIQSLLRSGAPVEAFKSRAGKGNYEMAQCLRALIVERRLLWAPSAGMIGNETFADELVGLRVKRMSYGYRFDHETQKHDDRAVAVGMMAMRALQELPDAGGIAAVPIKAVLPEEEEDRLRRRR